MNIEFGQILINYPERAKRATRVFISKNFPERERILGKIFGIVEIETDSPDKKKYQIIDNIINNLENNFYYHESMGDTSTDLNNYEINPEAVFEDTLKKTNEEILSLIQGGEIYLPAEKMHLIFGVIKDENLFFTNFGQMQSFLIFENKNKDLKIIDLIGNTKDASPRQSQYSRNPTKFFSNIISGKLNTGNSLLFTTDSLLDFLSPDRLKKVILTKNAKAAADDFKQLLSKVTPYVTFASIILKFSPEEIATENQEIPEPVDSIQGLISTEERTKAFLIPSLRSALKKNLISTKKYAERIGLEMKQKMKEKKERKFAEIEKLNLERESAEPIKTDGTPSMPFKDRLSHLFQKKEGEDLTVFSKPEKGDIKLFLKNKFSAVFSYLALLETKRSQATKNFIHKIADKINDKIAKLLDIFSRWPRLRQILFISSLILAFLFIQSLVYIDREKERTATSLAFTQTAAEIKKNLDDAEAGIIYNDEEMAKKLLAQTQSLLASLPQINQQERTTYAELNKRLQAQLQNLKKVINIEEPSQIVNFEELSPENNNIDIKGLLNIDNRLYAWSGAKKSVYQIDPDKKEITEIASLDQGQPDLKLSVILDPSSIGFIEANQSLTKLDLNSKTFSPLDLPLNNNAEIKGLAIYNNRLYVLDAANNQIYRSTKTPAGYSRGAAWVKEKNINLSDAVSLVIDSNVYVLKSDGTILKFMSGYAGNVGIQSIDPIFNQPTKIYTSADSNFLYILDPKNKRLVVVTKDGKLKNQYYSDQFDDLKDFVVQEKEKKIYLLNGTKVFGIIASHL